MDFLTVDVPALGTLQEVAPGVHWVRLPLPLALNHVNVWVLDDGPGWTVIDTGMNTVELQGVWKSLLDGPLAGKPVTRLIVTHYHPDHVGLAGWLLGLTEVQPELHMPKVEYLQCRSLQLDGSDALVGYMVEFYRQAGMDQPNLDFYRERGNGYQRNVHPLTAPFIDMRLDEVLTIGGRDWRILKGSGHAPDLAMLYCADDKIFISSDQVLPSISPNVSVWPSEPFADPLADFKGTLEGLDEIADDCLVLPGHGVPFYGLKGRAEELLGHHVERLEFTLNACEAGSTAVEISNRLFERELDQFQLLFAIGETIAHLNHLIADGALVRETGADGVWRYQKN